ncbi:hypothetical protein LCGC14_0924390 [marine sediment metagenome]|uniref:Uncharacterized protein n=1 Tax=marine sediment metagenome TaxID=412755 RepID=A0A0F9PAH6_9ZZZZ
MGTLAIATLVVAAAGTAAEISQQQKAAEAQEALIRERQVQNQLASTQRSARRAKKFEAVVSAQRAIAGAHGISLASPTFASIKLQSFEQFEKDNKNAALNASFENNALNTEIGGINAKATAGEWGAGISFVGGAFQQVDLGEFGEKAPDVKTRGNQFDVNNKNDKIKHPTSFGVTI